MAWNKTQNIIGPAGAAGIDGAQGLLAQSILQLRP